MHNAEHRDRLTGQGADPRSPQWNQKMRTILGASFDPSGHQELKRLYAAEVAASGNRVELGTMVTRLHAFANARLAEELSETPGRIPLHLGTLWYAHGATEAFLGCGEIQQAAEEALWIRQLAQRWSQHPDFAAATEGWPPMDPWLSL